MVGQKRAGQEILLKVTFITTVYGNNKRFRLIDVTRFFVHKRLSEGVVYFGCLFLFVAAAHGNYRGFIFFFIVCVV